MYINKIYLKNYRNIENLELELKDGVNIFHGNNAQGKTNILESVYMCSTGRSHRTHIDKEIIKFNKSDAHVRLELKNENVIEKIDIHLKKDKKKGIAINNIPINKLGELFGVLNIVMFSPEDLELIKAGPTERRRFLDLEICQINKIYYYNLGQYYKILKQRNTLLKNSSDLNTLKDTIFIWDEQLVKYGIKLIEIREKFVKKINEISKNIHYEITGNKEELEIKYRPNVNKEDFLNKLKKNLEKDMIYSSTSYGPHKDDIKFFLNNISAREFGSQGQQRTISLSVKLSLIKIIELEKDVKPVLLLDDVLSELDESRQKFLINNIKDIQVLITCTGVEDFVNNFLNQCEIFNVYNGKII